MCFLHLNISSVLDANSDREVATTARTHARTNSYTHTHTHTHTPTHKPSHTHTNSHTHTVVAISLSEFASKTDEIFRCKKHTILLTIGGHIYL